MRALLLALLLGLASAAHAQPFAPALFSGASGAAVYSGPGDIVSGAQRWWGLRAYNKAYATGSNNAATIKRASDSTSTTIKILATGDFDTATASAFCAATTCNVTAINDQAGSGTTAVNSSTAGPVLTFNCVGTLPCMQFNGGQVLIQATGGLALSQPFTFSIVSGRTGSFTSFGHMYEQDGSTFTQMGYTTSTNQIRSAGSHFTVTATASDSVVHAYQFIFNGASGGINVDNTLTTGSTSTDGYSGSVSQGIGSGSTSAGNNLTGKVMEIGAWASAFSPTDQTSMCHNQRSYWSTSGSC